MAAKGERGARGSVTCSDCELLPEDPALSGTLYIQQPIDHVRAAIGQALDRCGAVYSEPHAGLLAIEVPPGSLDPIVDGLVEALSSVEQQDSRAVLLPPGAAVDAAAFMRAESLAVFIASIRGVSLLDLLRDDRLLTHFQPIVPARDPDALFAYECLLRGYERDGTLIPPAGIFDRARDANLLYYLDRAARLRAIASVAAHRLASKVFINFNPTSIYNPSFCLRTTIAALADAGIAPEQVVFEVVESEQMHDTDHLVRILTTYRRAGFGVALDDLGSGFGSLTLLERLRPDYVKLDMGLVRNVHANPFRATVLQKLLEAAHELGVRTVAEGVEHREEFHWLRDHGADYLQGWLFGRPATPPPPLSLHLVAERAC